MNIYNLLIFRNKVMYAGFISSVVAEKMPLILTEQYLLERSQQSNQQEFLEASSKVPNIEPEEKD